MAPLVNVSYTLSELYGEPCLVRFRLPTASGDCVKRVSVRTRWFHFPCKQHTITVRRHADGGVAPTRAPASSLAKNNSKFRPSATRSANVKLRRDVATASPIGEAHRAYVMHIVFVYIGTATRRMTELRLVPAMPQCVTIAHHVEKA